MASSEGSTGAPYVVQLFGRAARAWKVAFFGLVLSSAANPAFAQSMEINGPKATRDQLASQVSMLESRVSAPKISKREREQAVAQISQLRARLSEGDFHVGDRFVYTITIDSVRSDTASVREGLVAAVSNLPDLSLKGVLRSELNDALLSHVSRYIRNATVRTNLLTRVSIVGAVRAPGYFTISPDRPISELISLAGGPAEQAKLDVLEITRGNETVLSSKESMRALKEGRTLEQVRVQSGDVVKIPQKRKFNWSQFLQAFSAISVLLFGIFQLITWYYSRQEQ